MVRSNEVFSTHPSRCFRYVENDEGRLEGCTEPVEWRGHFTPPKGITRLVSACDMHSGGLYRPDPVKQVRR
jgi:hypothetical protein